MSQQRECCRAGLVPETPDERQAITDGITMYGQPLSQVSWLQVDNLVPIHLPDGFRGIIYPDSHSPYQDDGVLRAIWRFAELWRPHLCFDIGDFLDFKGLSRFAPNAKEPTAGLFAELEAGKRQLRAKMRAGRPAKLIVIPGNHDDRERRQLSDGAAMFAGAVNASNRNQLTDVATNLLGFSEADNIMFAWGVGQQGGLDGGVMAGDVRLRHGNVVNARPGYSSYATFMRQLQNVFIGHVHRAGSWAYELPTGEVRRGGDLGNNVDARKPGFNYIGSDHDWIHAFGVMQTLNGVTHVQVVPFLLGEQDGKLVEFFTWTDKNHQILTFGAEES
jgi:hypothetical protein